MKHPPCSIDELRRLVRYDLAAGKLFWLPRTPDLFRDNPRSAAHRSANWNSRYAGKEAFCTRDDVGYLRGVLFKSKVRAHQVVWALAHGEWSSEEIDHINGDRCDNRIANLRTASRSENSRNLKRPVTNTTGTVGVHWDAQRAKWCAAIQVDRVMIQLGRFDRFEDAVAARKGAEREHQFHPNHGRAA